MGSTSRSSTKTANIHDIQNIDNQNDYLERRIKTYNYGENNLYNRAGDIVTGNVRNLQGMNNAGT